MDPRSARPAPGTRTGTERRQLMLEHRALTLQRQTVPLGGEEYQRIAIEIARVEVAIAAAEEPTPSREPAERAASRG